MPTRPTLPSSWARLERIRKRERAAAQRMRVAVHRTSDQIAPVESAKVAGLRYVNDETLSGIRRVGPAKHFRYVDAAGRRVSDPATLARIRSLVIPPAWTRVWICPHALGHIQATGRDARGRKQYRYHPRWREVRDEVKYGRLIAFAQTLPRIRQRTDADLRRSGLPREKVVAAVVQLLEKTLIRIGNEEYARENHSFGLTTMRDQHARINGSIVRFEFRGKSGIEHAVDLRAPRLTKIIKACRDLPGYELFQYVDENGRRQAIESADVNAYLREVTGQDFTAKDFRTWAGSVLAASALGGLPPVASHAQAKRNVGCVVESVAKRLGNTKTVCRTCYIHPAILEAYMDGTRIRSAAARTGRPARKRHVLTGEEAALVALIASRLKKKARESLSPSAA